MSRKPIVGVVLSGCGVYDGSEIHEAVLTLLALDRRGAEARCFAPDVAQSDVVNHLTGQAEAQTRNVLVESARIARGKIAPLASLDAAQLDALIFPGGFGAAKNLCSFAKDGPDCRVEPSVAAAIAAVHKAGKPIAALCISPALLAKALGGIEVTIGNDAETAAAIGKMGARHSETAHRQIVVDRKARVVTAPCYMLESRISDIADDADMAVAALLDLAAEISPA